MTDPPRFKIDENLPRETGSNLAAASYDAVTVLDQGLVGAADSILAAAAKKERRALLTLDLDFADIRAYPPEDYTGIVVFRLRRQDRRSVLAALSRRSPSEENRSGT